MASRSSEQDCPEWARQALQAVTYWIGHRRCLHRHYPAAEGALVAEICNLIHANLPDSLTLTCEVQYSKLLPDAPKPKKSSKEKQILTQRARADLVISKGPLDFDGEPDPKFIIEVKRSSAPKSYIDADLRRLAEVSKSHPHVRAFLFLIAEANRPDRFVDVDGKSRKRRQPIPGSDGHFRVRRTLKAARAIKNIDRAQYACLIEVYA